MCDLGTWIRKQSSAWAEAMQVPLSVGVSRGPLLRPIRASARVVPPRDSQGALTTSLEGRETAVFYTTRQHDSAARRSSCPVVSRQCSVLHVCVCVPASPAQPVPHH